MAKKQGLFSPAPLFKPLPLGIAFVAALAGGVVMYFKTIEQNKNEKAAAMYAVKAYETAATTTPSVDSMKNTILSNIYSSALNPNAVLTNLEAIKAEVNTYTSKLTLLAAERTAGRISALTLANYLQSLAQEVMTKLTIEFYPNSGGGGGFPSGGYGGGGGGYGGYGMDPYTQYLQYLQQQQRQQQQYAAQYQQYGYPNYGYSYGYGYQQPQVYSQSPLQTYNYYPQYAAGGYPQSSSTQMYGSGGYGQYGGGYGGASGYGGSGGYGGYY